MRLRKAKLKAVLLEIFLDWRLNSYLITILRDVSANAIIQCQIFRPLNTVGNLSLMWQGSWIRLWTVTSSHCSMSRLADWYLLRKITKHITLYYLCTCQKSI